MIYKIKFFVLLLFGSMMVVSGCGKAGSVSLEEALTVMHTDVETETDLAGIDDLSTIQEQVLCVYICGAVLRPGVYELEAGSRIVSAVEAAGGFLPEAATEAVNLAKRLEDGMQIVVPTMEEAEAKKGRGFQAGSGNGKFEYRIC